MSESLRNITGRIQHALRETGVQGVARRALRNVLSQSTTVLSRAEERVRLTEFEKRITAERRALLSANRRFKGIHKGERAFIIGNGPSLRGQNIEPLGDEITFGVNAFWKHPVTKSWSPDYYLVTDGLMFTDDPRALAFWRALSEIESTFFVPLDYIDIVRDHALLPDALTHFIALNGFLSQTPLDEVDITGVLPSPNSVVQTALMVAIYMGFEEVILLGCDHNWLDDPAGAGHFYQGKTAEHLASNEENEQLNNYAALLHYVSDLFEGYQHLEQAARRAGTRIINATDGGRLDLFERARLEDLVSS